MDGSGAIPSMILRDFQLWLGDQHPQQRAINWAAFPIAEAARLDLKRRRPRAPFAKICISLRDDQDLQPHAVQLLSICEARLPVDADLLAHESPATSRLVDLAFLGLDVVAAQLGFRDPDLASVLADCRSHDFPCRHRFDRLTRKSRSGTRCETWFMAAYGRSRLEVRFLQDGHEPVRAMVATEDGPMFLEDRFPVASSRLHHDRYQLLDRTGGLLAEIRLPSEPA
ncbi:MAG: hypothetical protein U1F60_03215 [Planctomycetota bacterium]